MPETSSTLITGIVSLLAGAMVGPIASDFWRKIKGSEYATRTDCDKKHLQMEKDCKACKAQTDTRICAIQHDSTRNHKLLLLIAIRLRIPTDELKDYM